MAGCSRCPAHPAFALAATGRGHSALAEVDVLLSALWLRQTNDQAPWLRRVLYSAPFWLRQTNNTAPFG